MGKRTSTDEAYLIHLAAAALPPLVEAVHAALEILEAVKEGSAQEIQETILKAFHQFVGGDPQFDDIALVVLGCQAG